MNKELNRNIRLGVFVVTGVILLIVGLYFIGNNKNMFNKTFRLHTVFQNVNGLTAGSNVRYSGIDVGTVDKIEFINDTSIYVEMVMAVNMKKIIKKNSVARVGTDGLMGNKLINIEPRDSQASFVEDNDAIESVNSVNTEAMLRTLEYTNQNVAFISSNLRNITENLDRSRGTLYTVLMDTTIAISFHNTLINIEIVSNNLNQASDQIAMLLNETNQGNGILGTLIKDTSAANDFQDILKSVKESGKQLSSATTEANDLIRRANSGSGTIPVLLNDTALANNLKSTISNLQIATLKLNEDLEGLKHSFLLRGYFRKQEKQKKKQLTPKN